MQKTQSIAASAHVCTPIEDFLLPALRKLTLQIENMALGQQVKALTAAQPQLITDAAIESAAPQHASRTAPQCDNCRHQAMVRTERGAVSHCDHPTLPVNVCNGAPLVPCAVAREIRGHAPYQGVCGESAALFQRSESASTLRSST